jgi:hypothetical protein
LHAIAEQSVAARSRERKGRIGVREEERLTLMEGAAESGPNVAPA